MRSVDDLLFRGRMQDRDWMRVYDYEEIMIVPHYSQKNCFVLPGGRLVKESDLKKAKARQSISYLWPRSWAKQEGVSNDLHV